MTGFPPLNRQQTREIDQQAIALGLPGIVLMENAGRGAAERLMQSAATGAGRALIFCGKGNNAGDGWVIARHLWIAGWDVLVVRVLGDSSGDAAVNQHVWERVGTSIDWNPAAFDSASDANPNPDANFDSAAACRDFRPDWVVDALLGTGASGPLRPPLPRVIALMNALPARRMAVDLPTGLDCDTGQLQTPTFQADLTCTFVAPKIGFSQPSAQSMLGDVQVIGIGAPVRPG